MKTMNPRRPRARRSRWIAAAVATAWLAGFHPSVAQEPRVDSAQSERERLERELVELFGKVERNLRAIDGELGSAAAGETPLGVPAESGIGALLQSARARGREVDQQVTRIIELAAKLQPP